MKPLEFCHIHAACPDGRAFAFQYATMAEVWDACPRADWLVWILRRLPKEQQPSDRTYRLFACWCVRETPLGDGRKVWDLLTDERGRNAVVVAERFAVGSATEAELREAMVAHTAYTAYAYAYAAYAAYAVTSTTAPAAYTAERITAYTAATSDYARKFQADHFRTLVPNPFRQSAS